MKTLYLSFIVVLVLITASCERNPLYIDGVAGDIVGHWIDQDYSDTLYTIKRASHIPKDYYGWTFNKDGTLIQRANSGFCGTPPIVYSDYEGFWSEKDSIIDIECEFWGGIMLLKWQIIEISESKLTYYQLDNTIISYN